MIPSKMNSKPKSNAATALLIAVQMLAGAAAATTAAATLANEAAADGDAARESLSLDNQIESVLDDIESGERRAIKDARRRAEIEAEAAAVNRLGNEPTPSALAYGRKATAVDPANFALRLRLIDLLSRAGNHDEADRTAAALVAERSLTPVESTRQKNARQRAQLKRVRMASDRGQFAYALKLLKELPALKPQPAVVAAAKKLESHIADRQRDLALRAELEQLRSLPPEEARLRVRAAVTADPAKLDLRLLLIDLLAEADLISEAEIEADRFVADPLTAADPDRRQLALFKKSRVVLKRDAFAQSRTLLDAALAQPVVEPRKRQRAIERATDLRAQIDAREHQYAIKQQIEAIGSEATPAALAASAALLAKEPGNVDVALHRARLLRNGQMFADAEALYAQLLAGPGVDNPNLSERINNYLADMRLRAEIDAIGDQPTAAAITRARALRARYPQSVDAAFHLALLLRKDRQFGEAESIYQGVLASQGVSDPEAADRAKLNLAQVYLGNNRLADASSLLQSFSADSSSPYVTGRIGDLGGRISQRLDPDQVSGFVSVAGGYDSNVITRVDLLDQEAGVLNVNKAASAFQTLDLSSRYRHVIDDNGNFLAVNGDLTHTTFNANPAGGIDRTFIDLLIGPVYALPSIDSVISGGFSYRHRLRDYDFARSSPGVLLRLDQILSNRLSVRTEALYERTNDNIATRDGNSYELRYSLRYALTARDDLGFAMRARRDESSADFEARSTAVGSLSYRQRHALVATPGEWFWGLAVNYTRLNFGAVNPMFIDQTRTRKDNNFQIDLNAGRDLDANWAAGLRVSFLGRDSTAPRNNEDSFRMLLSLTRRY